MRLYIKRNETAKIEFLNAPENSLHLPAELLRFLLSSSLE
jgi:hypothetical protein